MVSEKSKSNLRRGNPRNKGNKLGRSGKTWADLIVAFGETESGEQGKTWKQLVVEAAFKHAIGGNAAILKELMQRSEPQPLMNLDFSKLNTEQIERIANGEDPVLVLATPGAGIYGTQSAAESADTPSGGAPPL